MGWKEGPKELMKCVLRREGEQLCVTNVCLDKKLSGVDLPFRINNGRLFTGFCFSQGIWRGLTALCLMNRYMECGVTNLDIMSTTGWEGLRPMRKERCSTKMKTILTPPT